MRMMKGYDNGMSRMSGMSRPLLLLHYDEDRQNGRDLFNIFITTFRL